MIKMVNFILCIFTTTKKSTHFLPHLPKGQTHLQPPCGTGYYRKDAHHIVIQCLKIEL